MPASLETVPPQFFSACFYSTNGGSTVQRRISAADEAGPIGKILEGGFPAQGPLPAGVTNIYRFDESKTNNAGLLAQWQSNSAPFTMVGNTVHVSGNPAGFDPPGLAFEALQRAAEQWEQSKTTNPFSQVDDAQLRALVFLGLRSLGIV